MRIRLKAKQLAIVVPALLLALTACADKGSNGQGGTDKNGNDSAAMSQGGDAKVTGYLDDPVHFKFDPPVTITTASVYAEQKDDFKQGETIENNFWSRWVKDNIGVEVKCDFIVPQYKDFETKMRLLLAGGEKLPDTVIAELPLANDLMDAGQAAPLNELMDKYLSPNMKALFEKYPQSTAAVTRDGKIYGLPNFFAMDEGTVMWVRQDWLKNLGLEAPKTMDEFENVIKQFTEGDPDKNGAKDTTGLAVSLRNGPVTWMSTADALAGALTGGSIPTTITLQEFWTPDENGKLRWNAIDPRNKAFLSKMRDWVKAGYVDTEAGVKDEGKAGEMASGGKAGIIFGPFWMAGWPLGDGDAKNFVAYPVPSGADGKAYRGEKAMVHNYTILNKDFKNPEAFFAYYNKIMAANFGENDPYYDPRLKNGWSEGYDYVVYNDKVIRSDFKAAGVPSDKWPNPNDENKSYDPKFMLFEAPFVPYLADGFFNEVKSNPNAEPSNWMEVRVAKMNPRQLDAGVVRISQNDSAVVNQFTGVPTKTILAKGDMLTKLATESYLKIIYGNQPVDYFDKFVEEWKKSGGDAVTQEVNEWYDSVKK